MAKGENRVAGLYDLVRAKMVLKGGVVDAGDVQEVCSALDCIPLEDLGLDPACTPGLPGSGGRGGAKSVLRQRLTQLQASAGAEGITYLHIHEDELMTIGIFQLPEGARIPLHNHPGMTVFSRLLFGSLHIRAYDWAGGDGAGGAAAALEPQLGRQPHHAHPRSEADECEEDDDDGALQQYHPEFRDLASRRRSSGDGGAPKPPPPQLQQAGEAHDSGDSSSTSCSAMSCSSMLGVRPARLVADRVLAAPCPTSVLFPADGGNIHSFTALSPCAVLDVLTPPYAPACGRDCTYYREAFPPQLLDDAGHPLLMPAEDVAAWVRWQQAARGGGAPPAPPLPPRRSSSGSSGGGDADMGDAAAAAHPWAALGGGEQGLVMGLEATPMPQDFLVDRGVYRGKGVRG